ncbi:flagellar hook-length control protein FliK [Ferrovibrio sp.]|uniref:flagellar hook-length control protein FliK n=1 Tax=Ferrovibrio sp. TaxID=1917215 RepID=UPI0025B92F53|nr:flagellar hook-length control protein FliK [Ferrovibrio sp.]MBX3454499.1 flagellar hook-length control protein FliK [Ferrovibrio sp.]
MQIGSATSSSAASQAAPAFAADDTGAPDFANLLAGSYAAKAARRSEAGAPDLKGPEVSQIRQADRSASDRGGNDRADRASETRSSEPADKRCDRADDSSASAKPSDRERPKQADKPAEQTADAASDKPVDNKAETPAKPAADAAAKGEEAAADAEGKDKKAETQVDPLLLVAAPATAAVATTAHAAAAHAGAQAAGAGTAETPADAALRALQAEGLSPEAQQAALEAAKNAAQNAGQGKTEGKAAKLSVQTSSDASAQLSLVDTSSLFAEMLKVEGEEGLPPELAAELLGDHAMQLQNPLAGGAMVFDLASQNQAAAGNSSQQPGGIAAVAGSAANISTQAAHHTAHAQAARHPQALVPPGEQVAVQIKRAASEGLDTISIKLDPGNLGKVEVTMEVSSDGRLLAVIAADKPETLAMLQKDAQVLEQSLRDSGLKTNQDSLNFMLREQGQNGQGDGNGRGQRGGRGGDDMADAGQLGADPRAVAQAANAQRAAARGGLDIRI